MKRWIVWALVFVMVLGLFAGCGKDDDDSKSASGTKSGLTGVSNSGASGQPETVAGVLDLSGYAAVPDDALTDLRYWTDGESSYDGEPADLDGVQFVKYSSDMDTIKAYVEMLQNNGYTLVEFQEGYKGKSYGWGLTNDRVPNARYAKTGLAEEDCHVFIWWDYTSKRSFDFYVSPDLKVCDTGLRQNGASVSLMPQGESVTAGLIRQADGSYITSDGRLSADVGTAMVIRDGEVSHCDARFALDGGGEQVWIENYYRNEGIFFEAPQYYLEQGDLLQLVDLAVSKPIEFKSMGDMDGRVYNEPTIGIAHDGVWSGPGINETDYEAVTVRVMYLDRTGDAVFYFYARFDEGEPEEIEVLCAVDTTVSGEIKNATYMEVGDSLTVTYNPCDSASYQTYEWEIVEGGDNVKIDYVGTKCKVTAVDPGTATIRVHYSYTLKEPDVLTGIERRVPHGATQDYTFIIE